MSVIVASPAFVRRVLPVVLVEAAVLAVCVFAFVSSGHMGWIAVMAVFALGATGVVLAKAAAHRDEWRFTHGERSAAEADADAAPAGAHDNDEAGDARG